MRVFKKNNKKSFKGLLFENTFLLSLLLCAFTVVYQSAITRNNLSLYYLSPNMFVVNMAILNNFSHLTKLFLHANIQK